MSRQETSGRGGRRVKGESGEKVEERKEERRPTDSQPKAIVEKKESRSLTRNTNQRRLNHGKEGKTKSSRR
jgi:hypothetical protein